MLVLLHEPLRPGAQRPGLQPFIAHPGQDDDVARRRSGLKRLDHVETVVARQIDVEQHDLRLRPCRQLQRLLGIGRFANHLEMRVALQQQLHPLAEHRMIVDEENPDR